MLIVCVGDSLTGYNNFGELCPVPTYPAFLQEMLAPNGRAPVVLNSGQAGEVSGMAAHLTREYLRLCPGATHMVIAFGTNDLGQVEGGMAEAEARSEMVIRNLRDAFSTARAAGSQVLCFNVPDLNASLLGEKMFAFASQIRDLHNRRLAEYCTANQVALADIRSLLRVEHFADALHPNAAGARLIAEAVCSLIQSRT